VELPAGTLRGGERPIDCALRELCEETGYVAAEMRRMFSCYLAPGYSDELIHAFLARELTKGRASPEPDENLRVVRATLKQALGMIEREEIRDAKTIATVLWFVQFAKLSQ
jgi:ADP-ribose pyrophosphatase